MAGQLVVYGTRDLASTSSGVYTAGVGSQKGNLILLERPSGGRNESHFTISVELLSSRILKSSAADNKNTEIQNHLLVRSSVIGVN